VLQACSYIVVLRKIYADLLTSPVKDSGYFLAVRASRLVSLLLLLQNRGRMTANDLADELEVSTRTIYRDLEALSAAGVPVYSEPGRNGGCQLVDGYRTRLTGLTAKEAQALFAAGVTGPIGELGLGTVLGTAQLKLLAALPKELADRAQTTQQRFHFDAPGWFRLGRNEPHLATLATAVWEDRRVIARYQHPGAHEPVTRNLAPLGLVSKAGVWYLVAQRDGELRTYRVSRVKDVEMLEESFDRPADFDLVAYWGASVAHFEAVQPPVEVRLLVSPRGLGALRRLARPFGETLEASELLEHGRHHCVAAFDNLNDAYYELLRSGGEVEVVEPESLRIRLAETAQAMTALYA
jgi:predicted DNA-binding transcriptional regulator YafY